MSLSRRAPLSPSEKLFELTRKSDIPLLCTFELTQKCNLTCRHCYIDRKPGHARRGDLSTKRVKSILEELKNAGTLSLVFTGGEIFLRPDILQLCAYARKLGFDLRIFTNGTLVTEKDARCLSSLSLSGIEISLYGKMLTHDAVTRSRGSFAVTIETIRMLRRHAIPVTIKTPLMTLNIADLSWLKQFSKDEDVKLKIDPVLTPANDGNRAMLKYRLSSDILRDIYRDPAFFKKTSPASFSSEPADPGCSAGRNLVAIGHDGTVFPCLQLILPIGNLKRSHFSKIWNSENTALDRYRRIQSTDTPECLSCNHASFCQRCPGMALLEEGDITAPSRIACSIAAIIKSL